MRRRGERPHSYRERGLAACVGTLTPRIPKLRSGSFFSEGVLGRHRRVDRALVAAVAEMYATGASARKVQRAAEKMGVSRLSKDQVSAIASSLDADIEELCADWARLEEEARKMIESGLELADRIEAA